MPLKSAVFEVGELSGITAKELEEYLQENADFEFLIDETKAKVRCRCGYEGMAEIIDSKDGEVVFMCSKCGDIPEIISGDKVKVSEVQVKD
ncbi:MAG: hydrogenase maturation nickel metallochaperone HypA, partial [Nanoarchaeota archaeon]|nr:hydrogenase maturation nickel metallochaperone HypA [Nanoarchaeota archaeon]